MRAFWDSGMPTIGMGIMGASRVSRQVTDPCAIIHPLTRSSRLVYRTEYVSKFVPVGGTLYLRRLAAPPGALALHICRDSKPIRDLNMFTRCAASVVTEHIRPSQVPSGTQIYRHCTNSSHSLPRIRIYTDGTPCPVKSKQSTCNGVAGFSGRGDSR